MKVTTRQEMELNSSLIHSILAKFELLLVKEKKGNRYYKLCIKEYIDNSILKKIERVYKQAGWSKVNCKFNKEHTILEVWNNEI